MKTQMQECGDKQQQNDPQKKRPKHLRGLVDIHGVWRVKTIPSHTHTHTHTHTIIM